MSLKSKAMQRFFIRMERLPQGINSLILGIIYHPPQSGDHVLQKHIFKFLDSLLATYPNSAILVLGDFNQLKPEHVLLSYCLFYLEEIWQKMDFNADIASKIMITM